MITENNNRSYLKGIGHVHDFNFSEFALQNNKSEDQVIQDMVNSNWTQGMDVRGNFEYWENQNVKVKPLNQ